MSLEITQIIKQHLTYGQLNRIKVMSWGTHNWQGGKDFLIFKVQGHNLKGVVKITLRGNNTYTIEFFKGRATEPIKTLDNMYCDQITEVIDEYVKKIPQYKH